jgi:hypothetical protein
MADLAQFDHDRLGHLLSDRLLTVPRFQRSYSWGEENIEEFLEDLTKARSENNSYFMGTIVLASDEDDPARQLIVDGQQRLTTTAILLVAVRDRLRELGKDEHSKKLDEDYLRNFDIDQEMKVTRLNLNPVDISHYERLLAPRAMENGIEKSKIGQCYNICYSHTVEIAPTESSYRNLVDLVKQLDKSVQVLLAVAVNIAEAYVIFETLNDRGADLTTADLLKNYLLSNSRHLFEFTAEKWSNISGSFDKSEDFVKFIRHHHASEHGKTTNRNLYKRLQEKIGNRPAEIREYIVSLESSLETYQALRDPDHALWSSVNFDVRDSIIAYRRFGFESSLPLLLSAFQKWGVQKSAKLVNKVAAWSIRAVICGKLGGGVAEDVFCQAAVEISRGSITNQGQIREVIARIIPTDAEFIRHFQEYGPLQSGKAKYLLGCLERQLVSRNGGSVEALPDWISKSVTIEHIQAKSSSRDDFNSESEHERFKQKRDRIENLTLLERTLNRGAENKAFEEKKSTYQKSRFSLTQDLATREGWGLDASEDRGRKLAILATAAWPSS